VRLLIGRSSSRDQVAVSTAVESSSWRTVDGLLMAPIAVGDSPRIPVSPIG
jgi:hypothetical protein